MENESSTSVLSLNAVFEGGGVRGIAHVGALQRMEDSGFHFSHVAGTSAGALVAGLYAAGYTPEEMRNELMAKDFSELLIEPTSKLWNLYNSYGVYDSSAIYTWVFECLTKKKVKYFDDLEKDLTIRVTNITDRSYWDINKNNNPNMEVAEAITMSAAIPFFFRPRVFGESIIVDGGAVSNYPLSIFADSPMPTVGFKLVSDANINFTNRPKGLIAFTTALIETMRFAHDKKQSDNVYSTKTIHIDCGSITSTEFKIDSDQKKQLYFAGKDAATDFINNYGNLLRSKTPPGHLGIVQMKLSNSLVDALNELSEKEDYLSVLRIGAALSRTLHLEGMLQAREDIGKILENAAAMVGDHEMRLQALIDDIGWSMVSRHEREMGEIKIRQGIDLAKEFGNHFWAAKGYRHLAGIAIQRENLDRARDLLNESMEEVDKIEESKAKQEMKAGIHHGFSIVEIQSGNFAEAESRIENADEIWRELGDRDRIVKSIYRKGQIASFRGKWAKAKDYYREGVRECEKIGRIDELIRNYQGLAAVAEHEGEKKEAYKYKQKAENLHNQLPLPF